MLMVLVVSCALVVSCSSGDRELGDDFVLHQENGSAPFSIGLEIGGGGIQGLIDGDIQSYGYDHKYVTARSRGDFYFVFEKSGVKNAAQPAKMVKRVIGRRRLKSSREGRICLIRV